MIAAQEIAQEALKKLKQGKDTVPAYSAKFREHADRAGFSDMDLKLKYELESAHPQSGEKGHARPAH